MADTTSSERKNMRKDFSEKKEISRTRPQREREGDENQESSPKYRRSYQRSNHRGKNNRNPNGTSSPRHYRSFKQSSNNSPQDDSNSISSSNFEAVDISDVQLTEEEKSTLSSKGLKTKKIEDLLKLAGKLKIENAAGYRRQELVFEVLKRASQLVDPSQ